DIGGRLFFVDVERTVGLISLLSQRYDVVLMNPPYGDMPLLAKEYLKKHYPRSFRDLYACFLEQGLDLAVPNGFLGALVPWTYLFLSAMEKLRMEILGGESRPEFIQEYGYGILDGATVGTAGTIARRLSSAEAIPIDSHRAVFERLSDQKRDWHK